MAMVIRDPKAPRAFLGATDGAPIRLPQTETVLASLKDWQTSHGPLLSEAMEADLVASGRELSDIQIWQARTCLRRSVQMSFASSHIEPESL
jgi:hypothetical protein